jgi:hypothetical protein
MKRNGSRLTAQKCLRGFCSLKSIVPPVKEEDVAYGFEFVLQPVDWRPFETARHLRIP